MPRILAIIVTFTLGAGAGFAGGRYWQATPKATVAAALAPHTLNLNITDRGIYRVRKVVDGDTAVLENGIHIRYHGINAPESGHFVRAAAPMAAEATARNIALVEGKRVRLILAREPLDIHGRVVARVVAVPDEGESTSEEIDVCSLLVKEGLARAMGLGLSSDEYDVLKKLENEAKANKLGMWGLEDRPRPENGVVKPYCSTVGGDVYHLASCSTAKRIRPENLHQYATIEDAEAAGLKPCSRCVKK